MRQGRGAVKVLLVGGLVTTTGAWDGTGFFFCLPFFCSTNNYLQVRITLTTNERPPTPNTSDSDQRGSRRITSRVPSIFFLCSFTNRVTPQPTNDWARYVMRLEPLGFFSMFFLVILLTIRLRQHQDIVQPLSHAELIRRGTANEQQLLRQLEHRSNMENGTEW